MTLLPHTSPRTLPLEQEAMHDVIIIGGGLAGLSLSIQLAQQGRRVIVLEKEYYPFHRVCGEYISLESWNFLESLGYPLSKMQLPIIKQLIVSAPDGRIIEQPLGLGGFGISRYKIDADLARLARSRGVEVIEGAKVIDVSFNGPVFSVKTKDVSFAAKVVAGTWGKRGNLDLKWNRAFVHKKSNKLNNYIGVKYHIRTRFPAGSIALHNFSDGYCGISKVENDEYCLCYLTTARNLRKAGGSIARMEENILCRNPRLADIFKTAEFLWKEPETIAQISFSRKAQVENHVLMIGDTAGMITPLCGNGMSMALHAGKLAAPLIGRFLDRQINRQHLEQEYVHQWNTHFARRLRAGRLIQAMFGNDHISNTFIRIIKPFPKFMAYLIRQTHGQPF